MLNDYFSVDADIRPSIRHNKPKKTQNKKIQQEESSQRALLAKLYQARVSSGRDIWTGNFITEDHK